jgi:hypothetical protein
VIEGEIWDVAVDVRRGSPAYGRFFGARLTAERFEQLYLPPGLAHGFLVTSEVAQVEYKCTEPYDPKAEFAIAWNDPDLAIPWPTQPALRRDAPPPARRARLLDFGPGEARAAAAARSSPPKSLPQVPSGSSCRLGSTRAGRGAVGAEDLRRFPR